MPENHVGMVICMIKFTFTKLHNVFFNVILGQHIDTNFKIHARFLSEKFNFFN